MPKAWMAWRVLAGASLMILVGRSARWNDDGKVIHMCWPSSSFKVISTELGKVQAEPCSFGSRSITARRCSSFGFEVYQQLAPAGGALVQMSFSTGTDGDSGCNDAFAGTTGQSLDS